ncbi:MAG: YraN family protein [Pleurocapsa sp.]
MKKIGNLGENLVASWLKNQNYQLLHHNWHCRWGEIDLIAQNKFQPALIFVEVKTRSYANWDESGLLSITLRKQQKIIKTASIFLSSNPELAELPCRFDVALVSYQNRDRHGEYFTLDSVQSRHRSIGKPVIYPQGYQLTLQTYLSSAFDLS